MQVHYAHPDSIHGKTLFVQGPEVRHITKARRLGPGDEVVFTDGRGHFLHTRIDRCSAKDIHASIERTEDDPREQHGAWSTLALALLKADHFELALEKAVELGVHRVQPLLAERSVVRWKESGGARKLERWRRIAESAMKQSTRSWLPEVLPPVTVAELTASAVAAGQKLVVGDEEERVRSLADSGYQPPQPFVGVVGPEGAFSPQEKQLLADAGAFVLSLGPYRLRAETAAVVLISIMHGAAQGGWVRK